MNAVDESLPRKRIDGWLAATIAAFILGFLLAWWLSRAQPVAKPVCPQAPQATPGATARTASGGGGGKHGPPRTGSPAGFNGTGRGNDHTVGDGIPASSGAGVPAGGGGDGNGKVSGGGSFDVSGKTTVTGASGASGDAATSSDQPPAGGGGNGDLELPPANGSAAGDLVANATPGGAAGRAPGDAAMNGGGVGPGNPPQGNTRPPAPSDVPVTAPAGAQPLAKDSGGTLQSAPPTDDPGLGESRPDDKVVAALDYRYDKSGLPHYPHAIRVASGTDALAAAAAGPNVRDFSVTEIITDDSPDVAAAWYHEHLPAGWNELSMPSADAMDQAIAQTKIPATNGDPVSSMLNALIVGPQLQQSKPGMEAARAAGLTIFQPADPDTDHRMVLVIKDRKTGKTGVLLMKKADTQ